MANADDLLQVAYAGFDEAEAEKKAYKDGVDAERQKLLQQFANAKRIITAIRTLEDASNGKLSVSLMQHGGEVEPAVTITIRDTEVAARGMENRETLSDKYHGLIMEVSKTGVTLKLRGEGNYFTRPAQDGEWSENGMVAVPEIEGLEPALRTTFHWAGSRGYIKRPNVVRLVT